MTTEERNQLIDECIESIKSTQVTVNSKVRSIKDGMCKLHEKLEIIKQSDPNHVELNHRIINDANLDANLDLDEFSDFLTSTIKTLMSFKGDAHQFVMFINSNFDKAKEALERKLQELE